MKAKWGLALALLSLAGTPAKAVPILFSCLTNNSGQCPALTSQIVINATNPGSNRLSLQVINSGPIASSVTAVYFDFAGSLFSGFFSSTGSGPGVDFPIDGTLNPPNLPAGNTAVPPFVTALGIDSDPPTSLNGVGPGESLTLLLNIGGANNIGDVVDAFVAGSLRIGLHVQAIGTSGQSDSLISNPLPPGTPRNLIPEPGTYGLLVGGLLVLFGFSRRKARRIG